MSHITLEYQRARQKEDEEHITWKCKCSFCKTERTIQMVIAKRLKGLNFPNYWEDNRIKSGRYC